MLRLSVLDQSTIVTGRSPDASIRESIHLAQHCEALGYDRYWCAEHHNSDSQAGTAPEILIAAIAATTRRIRVGSGWRDAAALFGAEGCRAIPRVGRNCSGTDRPGAWPRARIGRAHCLCAEPPGGNRGRSFSGRRARPACLAVGREAGGGASVSRHPRATVGTDDAGRVDTRKFGLRCAGCGVFRTAVLFRAFHHGRTRHRAGAQRLPGRVSTERGASSGACGAVRMGHGGRGRRKKRLFCSARGRCGG